MARSAEPLLHKDATVMERQAAEMVKGMQLAMEAVGAATGVVGIKAKNTHAVEAVKAACDGTAVRIHLLGDYYPAGDEYDLVYEVTGRLIPPGGIPLQVGAVVCNVETFVNLTAAAESRPVTHKTLTIAGAVREPLTLTVPLGTSLRDCIEAAGGTTVADPELCIGGMMMGETTGELDRPVIKTTGASSCWHATTGWLNASFGRPPSRMPSASLRATSAAIARSFARATCSAMPLNRTRSCAAWRSPRRAPPTGISGRPCAARAACARSTPVRRSFFPRRRAISPKRR